MDDPLPKIGSIVTYLDKHSSKAADSTGYNQIGIVVAKDRMLIKRGKSIITVKCMKSGTGKYDTHTVRSPLLSESVVDYFNSNVMSVPIYDRGINALLSKQASSLFDSPVLMPKFEKLSETEFNKRWDKIECEARMGDFFFTLDSKSIVSKAIARFDNGSWSHVGTCIGGGQLSEAITSGVTIRDLAVYRKQHIHVGLYRLKELTDDQAINMRDFCLEQTGKSYNYQGVVKLGLKMLLGLDSEVPSPNGLIHNMDVYLVEYA